MRWVHGRRIAGVLAGAAVVLAVAIAIGPAVVARVAAGRATRALGTAVRVGWLGWNPVTGWWSVEGARVAADRGPAALAARRIAVQVYLWDVLRGRYRVRGLVLHGARVRLRATADGWGIPLPARAPAEGGGPTSFPAITVDHASARQSAIRLEPARGRGSSLRLRRLDASGSMDGERVWLSLDTHGRFDRGALTVAARVRTSPSGRRIRVRLAAGAVDLRRTIHLFQAEMAREVGGVAEVHARFDDAGHGTHRHRRLRARGAVRDVAVGARGVTGLRARRLEVPGVDVDLEQRRATVGRLALRGAEIWLRRGDEGPGVAGLWPPPANGGASPAWSVTVAGAGLTQGTVHYADPGVPGRGLDATVAWADLGVVGEPSAPIGFSFAATLGGGGEVAARGQLVRVPYAVTAHADLTGVTLPPLVPFVGGPLGLESGLVSGALDLTHADRGATAAGRLELTELKTIAPDPARPENVMAAKTVRAVVREARSAPPTARLDRLEVEWPYVLVDRTPTSIFPLSLVPAARGSDAAATPLAVGIKELRVHGGRIDFRDATLEPPYWRALAELDLTAQDIDVSPPRVASVRGSALVDELSPLRFEGTVGARTRVHATVQRLALRPFNAYLAGTSGYSVSSGAVDLDTEVVLERSQLEVTNRVVLSHFGIAGSGGEDPIARDVGIPLTLAIALMKDYRGDIALDLPFAGNVEEPTFSTRSVVLQAIVRAVRGAVMAPLNALGRVVLREGRIEDIQLSGIPFAPGDRQLDAAGRERMTRVSRVVWSHPELGVRVRGTVAASDVQSVQERAALGALGEASGVAPLRAFLAARLGGKPLPRLSDAQRRQLDTLVAAQPWPAEALHALAVDRGAATAAAFFLEFHLEPQRVTVEEPPAPTPDTLASEPEATIALRER
jgi:hypothetical protein